MIWNDSRTTHGFYAMGEMPVDVPEAAKLTIPKFHLAGLFFTWAQRGAFRFVPYAYFELVPHLLLHHTTHTDTLHISP